MIANLIDIIYKLVAIIGIIVAGLWAYFLYVKKRIGVWNLEVSVLPEQIEYSDKHSILMVNVSLKNIGSVKILPGSRGCELSVKQVPQDLQEGALIDWKTSKMILQNYDFVEQWNDEYGAKDESYCIEPGCEYHERQGIVVPRRYLYIIEVTFWVPNDKDAIAEHSYIYVK